MAGRDLVSTDEAELEEQLLQPQRPFLVIAQREIVRPAGNSSIAARDRSMFHTLVKLIARLSASARPSQRE